MGCDGGTIPTRDELVKVKKKPVRLDPQLLLDARWKYCQASKEELQRPIVIDQLGRLYNKMGVVSFLLERESASAEKRKQLKHIRSLKDVREVTLTDNKGVDYGEAKFSCPISGLVMDGRHRFYTYWTCGCMLSERAIKECPSSLCLQCGKPVSEDNLIVINGGQEDEGRLRDRMKRLRAEAKLAKKAKKAAADALTAAMPPPGFKAAAGSSGGGGRSATGPGKDRTHKIESRKPSAKRKAAAEEVLPVKAQKIRINNSLLPGLDDDLKWHTDSRTSVQDTSTSNTYKSIFRSSIKNPIKRRGTFTATAEASSFF